MSEVKKTKVLIVGSGIAGLAAAQKLVENNFDVEILEARNDHGGRIRKNETFGGFPIEIGAEEIHKPDTLYHKLAIQMGAVIKPDSEVCHFFEDVDKEELVDRELFLENHADLHFYEEIVSQKEKQDDNQSLLTFYKNKGLPDKYLPLYEGFIGAENGGSLREISVQGYGVYESAKTSDHELSLLVVNMSHVDILNKAFVKVIPLIKYQTPIAEINYTSKEETAAGKSSIVAFDANGVRYEGDFLILTVPITQLQNNTISFNPELPHKKLESIKRMRLGRGGKIHFKFKNRFWPANTRNMYFRSRISFLWNLLHIQKGTEALETNIIAGLIAGDLMDDMQDPVRRQVLIDEVLEKMARVFNYPKVKEELEDVLWSDFTQVEFIEGNYSLPVLNMGGARAIYQEPVDDVLFFAGEASHLTDSMTIHGAHETGLRDAQRIIDICSQKKQSS